MKRASPETLHFKQRELPKSVIIEGEDGRLERYLLMPAGRKVGASLQKVDDLNWKTRGRQADA